jgi:hypothetical protein
MPHRICSKLRVTKNRRFASVAPGGWSVAADREELLKKIQEVRRTTALARRVVKQLHGEDRKRTLAVADELDAELNALEQALARLGS